MNFISKKIIKQTSFAIKCAVCLFFLFAVQDSFAQVIPKRDPNAPNFPPPVNMPEKGRELPTMKDTLGFQHRDDLADSITISFKYLDSLRIVHLDSSINDFGKVYSVPSYYTTTGNNGSAAFPILFSPILKSGWDAGFHAFDVYQYNLANTRFFNTTRPYTELSYFLASGKEQVVKVLHTQNIKPNWNAGIEYRLITSAGIFQTQNTNHNSYRFFSNYQGKKKRYAAYLILLGNKIAASENGGIVNDSLLKDPTLSIRSSVPVNLGGDVSSTFNIFSTDIVTGNHYKNFTAFFRQSYDFGIKDSIIINDSTTDFLFYPKFRMQHTITYSTASYRFEDAAKNARAFQSDSAFFHKNYDVFLKNGPSVNFWRMDEWKMITNDFTLKQFPQTKNPAQFIEAGIRLENYKGTFSKSFNPNYLIHINPEAARNKTFSNLVLHGEYRNKTRNKKWDAILKGDFYLSGFNAADFFVYASIKRYINPKWGDVQLSFYNINRTPSFNFNEASAFNFENKTQSDKENITIISAETHNPRFNLMARNISIANYTYYTSFYQTAQFSGLLNLTQITASAKTPLSKYLNLYSDFMVQQTTGKNPIRVPLFYTRQRLAFEGNFFKNLNLSTGLDVQYHTPYLANNYSPVMGAFFPQDSVQISNLPQVDVFFNFRIKSFTGFVKAENLNTVSLNGGLGWMNNNFSAPLYPTPGFVFRFGIVWDFVN